MKLIGEDNKAIKCVRCGCRNMFHRKGNSGWFFCVECGEICEQTFIRTEEKSHFVFLGCPDDAECLIESDVVGWTSHKEAEIDDVVFLYITAPVSAIVAGGIVVGGYQNEDIRCKYYGRWMSELLICKGISDESPNVPMKRLRQLFPEWNWLRYPRQNTQIPYDLVQPFLEMMRKETKKLLKP